MAEKFHSVCPRNGIIAGNAAGTVLFAAGGTEIKALTLTDGGAGCASSWVKEDPPTMEMSRSKRAAGRQAFGVNPLKRKWRVRTSQAGLQGSANC